MDLANTPPEKIREVMEQLDFPDYAIAEAVLAARVGRYDAAQAWSLIAISWNTRAQPVPVSPGS